MKIDINYLKELLEAFQNSEKPSTNIIELQEHGLNYDEDKFIFHLQILEDQGLVEGNGGSLGYTFAADDSVHWSVLPIRLTASGHEFISQLKNKAVWNTITKDFKEDSIGTIRTVASDLFTGYIKNKITDLIGG